MTFRPMIHSWRRCYKEYRHNRLLLLDEQSSLPPLLLLFAASDISLYTVSRKASDTIAWCFIHVLMKKFSIFIATLSSSNCECQSPVEIIPNTIQALIFDIFSNVSSVWICLIKPHILHFNVIVLIKLFRDSETGYMLLFSLMPLTIKKPGVVNSLNPYLSIILYMVNRSLFIICEIYDELLRWLCKLITICLSSIVVS